jgi:hypothetical protein
MGVAPAVGDVEQASAGHQRAGVLRQLAQGRGAGLVDVERDVPVVAGDADVARLVPVEQLGGHVVGLGDVAVQRHGHVAQDDPHGSLLSSSLSSF